MMWGFDAIHTIAIATRGFTLMHRTMLMLFAVTGTLILAGCTSNTSPVAAPTASAPKATEAPAPAPPAAGATKEAKIQAALAKLDPADRKLAEAQRWCAVNNKGRLGTMGTPYKVMINGEPVFLCCDGCEETAKGDPAKTLAKVAELKKKAAAETKTP